MEKLTPADEALAREKFDEWWECKAPRWTASGQELALAAWTAAKSGDGEKVDDGKTLRQAVDELRAVTRAHNVQLPMLDDLRKEREEDAQIAGDAERFRWLLEKHYEVWPAQYVPMTASCDDHEIDFKITAVNGSDIRALIDAARAEVMP